MGNSVLGMCACNFGRAFVPEGSVTFRWCTQTHTQDAPTPAAPHSLQHCGGLRPAPHGSHCSSCRAVTGMCLVPCAVPHLQAIQSACSQQHVVFQSPAGGSLGCPQPCSFPLLTLSSSFPGPASKGGKMLSHISAWHCFHGAGKSKLASPSPPR